MSNQSEKQSRLGSFIRRRREEMDMSTSELAEQTPVTESTINDIERGEIEIPSQPVLAAIARALNVRVSQLENLLPAGAEPAEEARNSYVDQVAEAVADKMAKRLVPVSEGLNSLEASIRSLKRRVETLEAESQHDAQKRSGMDQFFK